MAAVMAPEMPEIGTHIHQAASRFAFVAQGWVVDSDAKCAIGILTEATQQCVVCHGA